MDATPPGRRRLLLATLGAFLLASVVLVVAVLPAEYGIDPTGFGQATGLTRLRGQPDPPAVVEPPEDAPLHEVRASWRLVTLPLASREGHLGRDEGEARIQVPIGVPNLTSVTARLTWNDTDLIDGRPTSGDTLEISIRGPDGARSQLVQATNEPGRPGNATVTLALRSVPYPREEDGALVVPLEEDRRGVGNWTFVVRLYAAGGVEGREEKDPGASWNLTVTGEAWEAEVRRDAQREGDRVRISLAPRSGVEYKFLLREGAPLSYAWTSSAPLYWDLHGEEEGRDPEDATSHAQGLSARESGRLVAPFDGRHGWYWRNDHAQAVTIELQTQGDYVIVGVPR